VTGRAPVEIVSVELTGLVLGSVTLVVEKSHLELAGRPLEQDKETEFG
jgi:hypothetical protein